MVYTQDYRIGIEDIGKGNAASNRALLAIMEDVGCLHSDSVGYGVMDIEEKQRVWVLLDWQMQVLSRPAYGSQIRAATWSRGIDKICALRDYELSYADGSTAAIGTSRWVFFDTVRHRPARISEDIARLYDPEEGRKVFAEEMQEIKFSAEELAKADTVCYTVQRRDIDLNMHMHNICYLDAACEALPPDIYEQVDFDRVRIQYKHELKLGDRADCACLRHGGSHIVCMSVGGRLHAAVSLSQAQESVRRAGNLPPYEWNCPD